MTGKHVLIIYAKKKHVLIICSKQLKVYIFNQNYECKSPCDSV